MIKILDKSYRARKGMGRMRGISIWEQWTVLILYETSAKNVESRADPEKWVAQFKITNWWSFNVLPKNVLHIYWRWIDQERGGNAKTWWRKAWSLVYQYKQYLLGSSGPTRAGPPRLPLNYSMVSRIGRTHLQALRWCSKSHYKRLVEMMMTQIQAERWIDSLAR